MHPLALDIDNHPRVDRMNPRKRWREEAGAEMHEINLAIPSVSLWTDGNISLVTIDELSRELKKHIKDRLSEICWGPVSKGKAIKRYSYEETMNSLWRRISTAHDNTKTGMVGELITHLFLVNNELGYESVNRFFNLEERSIKKGFDLVLRKVGDDSLSFVEVKSGGGSYVDRALKLTSLLKTANDDIASKLDNPEENLWDNALNHCRTALTGDLREKIEEMLEQLLDDALKTPKIQDYEVILSGIAFSDESEFCAVDSLKTAIENREGWAEFKSIVFFAAQKKTYHAVVDFIKEEAGA